MRDVPEGLKGVPGAQDLLDWFGDWPGFHDAEVISLHLNRRAASTLVVHTWRMTNEVDAKGYYVQDKHVVVEFSVSDVTDAELSGFSHQNVVFGLTISKGESGFTIDLDPSYGIGGTIVARHISIKLHPGMATDS